MLLIIFTKTSRLCLIMKSRLFAIARVHAFPRLRFPTPGTFESSVAARLAIGSAPAAPRKLAEQGRVKPHAISPGCAQERTDATRRWRRPTSTFHLSPTVMPDDPSSSSSSRFAHRKSDFKSTPSAGLHRERRVTQVSESQRRVSAVWSELFLPSLIEPRTAEAVPLSIAKR